MAWYFAKVDVSLHTRIRQHYIYYIINATMKKIFTVLLGLVCLTALTGCDSSDNNNNYTERTFTDAFAYINDIATATDALIPSSADCKMRIYYGDNTAEVMLAGLKTIDDVALPTITVSGLSWRIDRTGWYVLEAPADGKLTVSGSVNGKPVEISNFTLRFCQRQAVQVGAGGADMGFVVSFTVASRYRYTLAYPRQLVYGKTTSTLTTSGAEFATTVTSYELVFNVYTRTLNINLNGAKFVQNMPALNISFKNIPFTINGTKAYWTMPELTPYLVTPTESTENKSFPITNLTGEYDFGKGLTMDFECNPKILGDGTQVYAVKVDCAFANSSPNDVQ